MRNFLLTCCITLFAVTFMTAQDYKSSVGGKLGYGLVGSYKTFLNEKSAVELFGGLRGFGGGLVVGGFYQIHKDIPTIDNLRWFIGGGASFSTWTFIAGSGYTEITGHFDIGLEYTFDDLPLNISVDYAPGVVLVDTYKYSGSYGRFRGGYGALTVRYILDGDKK
ncbi:MAG TPA: hypothetical protein PKD85_18185 [Saprospiraceae bacterium]|nr:hypothetical protein [Saprospiraceae bacterium]